MPTVIDESDISILALEFEILKAEYDMFNPCEEVIASCKKIINHICKQYNIVIQFKDHIYGTENKIIEELDLSVRAYNALKRAGINTIEEIRMYGKDRLSHIRNLGAKCLQEIEDKLAELGYVLGE